MLRLLLLLALVAIAPSAASRAAATSAPAPFPFNYSSIASTIIKDAQANMNFSRFEYLCDTFGPRYRGTPGLTNALAWIVETMKDDVIAEPVVNITNWVRGTEYLNLLSPRVHPMALLGLGTSVGTPTPINATALVVSSFSDLNSSCALAKGKIVVYNVPFTNYSATVAYRAAGASAAAACGAVAALVRSITPFSLYTPHTGVMWYQSGVSQIPAAAITVEDAEMLGRMQARGQQIVLQLYMGATTAPYVTSYNIIADLKGSTQPSEIVLLGGHSDSWDVGQGAVDDGGGLFSSWEAVRRIGALVKAGKIPRPQRTIRVLLWVDEEIGQRGAQTYAQDYAAELPNHVAAFESDSGNFAPVGFGFTGTPAAVATVASIAQNLLQPVGAVNVSSPGADTDNSFLSAAGVPLGALHSTGFYATATDPAAAFYFFYHHSNADTITAIDPVGLANSVAAFGVMTYVLADMAERLPFGNGSAPAHK